MGALGTSSTTAKWGWPPIQKVLKDSLIRLSLGAVDGSRTKQYPLVSPKVRVSSSPADDASGRVGSI